MHSPWLPCISTHTVSSLSYQTQTRRPKEVASGTDQVAKHKKHKSSQINLNYDAKGNLEFHLKRPNAPANLTSDLGETALLRWLFFISSFLRCTVLGYHASRHTRCHHCHYNHHHHRHHHQMHGPWISRIPPHSVLDSGDGGLSNPCCSYFQWEGWIFYCIILLVNMLVCLIFNPIY